MTETIFFNLWQTHSRENQDLLVAEMRSEAAAFRGKPGFLGLTVWTGLDNHRVIVEGRWRSQAHFDAAVSESPEAIANRARLEKFGKAEPGLFSESFRIEPEVSEAVIPPGEGVILIQVWEVGTSEHQQGWLTTMRENVSALTGKSGFRSLRTHASDDGKRVAVYAQWRDRASLEAAIATPETAVGSETLCNTQTAVAALSQTANTSSYHGVGSGTFLPMQDASCLAARVAARRVFGSMTRPALLVTIAWRWTDDCGCC